MPSDNRRCNFCKEPYHYCGTCETQEYKEDGYCSYICFEESCHSDIICSEEGKVIARQYFIMEKDMDSFLKIIKTGIQNQEFKNQKLQECVSEILTLHKRINFLMQKYID